MVNDEHRLQSHQDKQMDINVNSIMKNVITNEVNTINSNTKELEKLE